MLIYDTEGVETIFLGSKFPEELAGVSMHFPLALQKRKVGVQSLSFSGERSEVLSVFGNSISISFSNASEASYVCYHKAFIKIFYKVFVSEAAV